MKYKRADRVAALLKEEVSNFLIFELKNVDLGFITITRVKMSNDLRHAKIYFSILGEQDKIDQAEEKLQHISGMIRGEIGQRLGLRYAPELHFYYDDSMVYAAHIQALIDKIHREEEP